MVANISLPELPVEILCVVFEHIDMLSLWAICLVSHRFNDIGTPILYRSMLWEVYSPPSAGCLEVFKRRPQLRQVIREIKLRKDTWRRWESLHIMARQPAVEQCAQELSLLPFVHTLTLCGHTPSWNPYGVDLYRNFIKRIRCLKEVRLDRQHGNYLEWQASTVLPSGLTKISSLQTAISQNTEKWIQSNKTSLECLALPDVWSDFSFLSGFQNLKKLQAGSIRFWKTFMETIGGLRRLEELSFSVEQRVLETNSLLPHNIFLPRLLSLEMAIFGYDSPVPINSIYHAYEILASPSRLLETLRVKTWYGGRLHQHQGERFAKWIAQNHGPTIRSIILDDMTLSPNKILYLCSRCPNLCVLGFSLPKETDMIELSTALSFLRGLSYLRLTIFFLHLGPDPQEFNHLLVQNLPELLCLHVRWDGPGHKMSRTKYTLWKRRWSYDQHSGSPKCSLETGSSEDELVWNEKLWPGN
ncbi:hypothetical protein CPB86DRAFT_778688 [Serendipita vermifera]|nr:hypothetical protein CPB86DRAFT_778688 [Serendipita vermifera]